MPILPDSTSLGRVSPSGGKAIVDPDTAFAGAQDKIVSTAARSGAGLERLGQGISDVGASGMNYALRQREEDRKLSQAWTQTNLTVALGKIDQNLKSQTDLNVIRNDFPKAYDDAYRGVIDSVPNEDDRALFDAHYRDELEKRKLAVTAHAEGVERDNFISGMSQSLDGLKDIASRDPTNHGRYLGQVGEFVDAAVGKGYISPAQGNSLKNEWTRGVGHESLARLPAQDRLAVVLPLINGGVSTKDLQPHEAALLNAIAGPESGGAYNIRYTPNGGASFEGFGDHPRLKEVIQAGPNKGKTSDAAGRYQFLSSTWDSLPKEAKGNGQFTPENQDRAALYLARQDYRRNTGRDLDADLKEKGFTPEIAQSLGSTWEGFKTAPAKAIAAYNATLRGDKTEMKIASALSLPDLEKVRDASLREIEVDDHKSIAQHNETLRLAKEHSDDAANEWVTKIYTGGNSADAVEKIATDPRLGDWRIKESLIRLVQQQNPDEVAAARREYGTGYWDAYKAIIAAPGSEGRIDDPRTLLDRAGPGGDLTLKGVSNLLQVSREIAKNPDAQSIHSAKAHILDALKQKMSFDGEMLAAGIQLKNPEGLQRFNQQFVPAFEQAYSEWVRKGNDPWDFLRDQKRIDEIAKPYIPSKSQFNSERIAAMGGGGQVKNAPPAPEGVDAAKWAPVVSSPPKRGNALMPVADWDKVLRVLIDSRGDKTVKDMFTKRFGVDADETLGSLGLEVAKND